MADYTTLINDPTMPLFDRAISGGYPSGSTFKLIVAAAALQEGIITPQTTVNSLHIASDSGSFLTGRAVDTALPMS